MVTFPTGRRKAIAVCLQGNLRIAPLLGQSEIRTAFCTRWQNADRRSVEWWQNQNVEQMALTPVYSIDQLEGCGLMKKRIMLHCFYLWQRQRS